MSKNINVPKLRFREFSGEWEDRILKDFSLIYDGTHQTPKYIDKGVPFVSVENINNIEGTKKYISIEDFENFTIKPEKNDILMTRITAGIIGATAIVKTDEPLAYYVSLALIRVKENQSIDVPFLSHYINSIYFKHELHKRIIHTAFPKKINLKDIGECHLSLSSKQEQEKIAIFLSSIDEKIEKLIKKDELLQQYKKSIMQKIFSQEIRFTDDNGNKFSEWENIKFGYILSEDKEKTTINNQYEVLSSTKDDIVPQSEYFNREIASKDNTGYKVLKRNQLVFSPQNLWLGNININTKYEIGIVSPSYKIYTINETIVLVNYLKYIIKSPEMMFNYEQASEQGASIVRRSLNIDLFNAIKINIPCIEEQNKIANFLSNIDDKIEENQKLLEKIKEFKKSLLQQMFI